MNSRKKRTFAFPLIFFSLSSFLRRLEMTQMVLKSRAKKKKPRRVFARVRMWRNIRSFKGELMTDMSNLGNMYMAISGVYMGQSTGNFGPYNT